MMSSLKFERKEKPESAKLIRQLVCYLLLKNQNQLRIKSFLGYDTPPESVDTVVHKQYRTFFRYIGEILSCISIEYDNNDEFEDQWITAYSRGSFYSGWDTILQATPIYPNNSNTITPIQPSPAHRERLIRTMSLAQEIVENVVDKNEDDYPPVQFFQSIFWPEYKSYYRKTYSNGFGLKPRTVQRDMYAVFSAVTQYFEMSYF